MLDWTFWWEKSLGWPALRLGTGGLRLTGEQGQTRGNGQLRIT